MSPDTKLVYIVKHTNNLNTIIHATRRGKNLEFNPREITKEGKNIITNNIGLNLIKMNHHQEWNQFVNLKEVNLYEAIKTETASRFEEHSLPFKTRQKEKYLTQYIVSLSPHFWEQQKMIEYKSLMINNETLKWGVNHLINEKELTKVFDTIANSIQTQRKQAGINNFVASIIHLDEKTPHMHMFFANIINNKQQAIVSIKQEPHYTKMRDHINQDLYQKHHLKIQEKETMSHMAWKQNFEKLVKDENKEQLQPLSPLELQDKKIKDWEKENLLKIKPEEGFEIEKITGEKTKTNLEKDYKEKNEKEHER